MSRITKMKYVAAETMYDYSLPSAHQTICTILKALGNNTHMARNPSGEEFIVSMPPKFRHHVYVKRGSFVITEPIPEGKKVKAEIVRVLLKQQIKYFNDQGIWPETFMKTSYLDNQYQNEVSDRGFVHGQKIYYTDCDSVRVMDSKAAPSNLSDSTLESESDDESDLVPNCNKKAVTRIVFDDDSSSSEDETDCSSSEDSDSHDDEESDEDSDAPENENSNCEKPKNEASDRCDYNVK